MQLSWRGKRAQLSHVNPLRNRILTRRALLAGAVPATLGLALNRLPGFALVQHEPSHPAIPQAGDFRVVVPGLAAGEAPASIPLRQKIGQMIFAGFRGLEVGPERVIARDIAERNLGGVVLFDYDVPTESTIRNIESPEQVHALTSQLQSYAATPLLIAVDQEGGLVARLDEDHGFPATLSAAELGAIDDVDVTYSAALTMAETLAAAGINLNFAPVVDLNVNPDNPVIGAIDRSFSADPAAVTRHAEAFIRAHHDRGMLTSLKHFPGHGSSAADSHQGFVDVTSTWTAVELDPYENLVAGGLTDVVMTAHVFNANLDPDYAATLSHATVTGVLRGDIGYGGVVISDDMQMAAITEVYGFETAVLKSIEAGIDILLFGNNLVYDESTVERVIDLVESLVAAGSVSETRIDQSYARITALKTRLLAPATP